MAGAPELLRGDQPPRIVTPLPGPRARVLGERIRRAEAPGINTVFAGEPGTVWAEALGANVLDVDGNRYLDFTSGFGAVAVGHRHPRVVDAARRQAERLVHGLGDVAGHPARIELAERLALRVPGSDRVVYFASSGADAVEIALKTAILATGRTGFVSFEGSYHGLTLGALSVTGRQSFRHPFDPLFGDRVRFLPFGAPADRLDEALDREPRPAAAVVEPIQGRGGGVTPPRGWLALLAERCRRHGALLVVDEILTGAHRTGPFFAAEREEVEPDLLCCGKAIGGGFPIAATLGDRSLMAAWEQGGEALHTATFVAHPLSCAAALATLELLDGELGRRPEILGAELGDRLARLPGVAEARGTGLLWGLRLDAGAIPATAAIAGARNRGLLLLAGGAGGEVLEFLPPYCATDDQIETALDILAGVLAGRNR